MNWCCLRTGVAVGMPGLLLLGYEGYHEVFSIINEKVEYCSIGKGEKKFVSLIILLHQFGHVAKLS